MDTFIVAATLVLRIYASAPVSEVTVAVMEEVFHSAGVAVEWQECHLGHEACSIPISHEIVVRIVDARDHQVISNSGDVMGYTPFLDGESSSSTITVYLNRIKDLARENLRRPDEILGFAVAHELGHALLGPGAHNRKADLMKSQQIINWHTSLGDRRFTADEAERIRLAAAARWQNDD